MNVCTCFHNTSLHLFTDVEINPGGSQQHPQLWDLWEQDTFNEIQLSNVTRQCSMNQETRKTSEQVTVLQLRRCIMHE